MNRSQALYRRQQGFTLIEVMIAVLVVTVGLLGFAKMQALAISSTQVASSRSMIALQSASLAASMHGNRTYWAGGVAPAAFSTSGLTVTDATGVLSATPPVCRAATLPSAPLCTPAQLAAYDLQLWATSMASLFPAYTSAGTCTVSASTPINCTVTVSWTEKYVSSNQNTASNSASTAGTRTYTLYVEP